MRTNIGGMDIEIEDGNLIIGSTNKESHIRNIKGCAQLLASLIRQTDNSLSRLADRQLQSAVDVAIIGIELIDDESVKC